MHSMANRGFTTGLIHDIQGGAEVASLLGRLLLSPLMFDSRLLSRPAIATASGGNAELISKATPNRKERLFFITDAVAEVLTGEYQHIYKGDRYTLPDGTLSGSSLTMMQSVINGVRDVGLELEEALRMASTYPARLLGPDYKLGLIAPGYEASFVIFENEMNVVVKE